MRKKVFVADVVLLFFIVVSGETSESLQIIFITGAGIWKLNLVRIFGALFPARDFMIEGGLLRAAQLKADVLDPPVVPRECGGDDGSCWLCDWKGTDSVKYGALKGSLNIAKRDSINEMAEEEESISLRGTDDILIWLQIPEFVVAPLPPRLTGDLKLLLECCGGPTRVYSCWTSTPSDPT